jgi:putative tricarboxylic transport membrane protein
MKRDIRTKSMAAIMASVMVLGMTACSGNSNSASSNAPASSDTTAAAQKNTNAASSNMELKDLTIYTDGTPGSSADMIMRKLGEIIQADSGITVNYENVAGAGGSNAKTAMMSNRKSTSIVMDTCSLCLEIADGSAPYDLTKLQPVTSIAQEYIAIVTSPDSQFNTLDDLIEYAKANPETINWGASSAKGSQQLFEQYIVDETGTEINYIAYDSAQNAKVAVIAGDIDIATASAGNLVSDIAEGVYKCLAVSAPERYEDIPDVPTLAECGITGNANENSVWRGFFCSADMDEDTVRYVAGLIEEAKTSDAWSEFLEQNHISAWDLNHDDFAEYVNDYLDKCSDAVARME